MRQPRQHGQILPIMGVGMVGMAVILLFLLNVSGLFRAVGVAGEAVTAAAAAAARPAPAAVGDGVPTIDEAVALTQVETETKRALSQVKTLLAASPEEIVAHHLTVTVLNPAAGACLPFPETSTPCYAMPAVQVTVVVPVKILFGGMTVEIRRRGIATHAARPEPSATLTPLATATPVALPTEEVEENN